MVLDEAPTRVLLVPSVIARAAAAAMSVTTATSAASVLRVIVGSFPGDCVCKTPGARAIFPQAGPPAGDCAAVVEAFRERDAVPNGPVPDSPVLNSPAGPTYKRALARLGRLGLWVRGTFVQEWPARLTNLLGLSCGGERNMSKKVELGLVVAV